MARHFQLVLFFIFFPRLELHRAGRVPNSAAAGQDRRQEGGAIKAGLGRDQGFTVISSCGPRAPFPKSVRRPPTPLHLRQHEQSSFGELRVNAYYFVVLRGEEFSWIGKFLDLKGIFHF